MKLLATALLLSLAVWLLGAQVVINTIAAIGAVVAVITFAVVLEMGR